MTDTLATRALDREAHGRRDRLASTLDELTVSLTPGRFLDEVLSYAKSGGGNFLMGLGKSAAVNPIPTLLVTAGCALFLSGRGGFNLGGANNTSTNDSPSSATEFNRSVRGRQQTRGFVSKATSAVSGVVDKVGGAASSVASVASGLGAGLVDTASGAAGTVTDKATAAAETVVSAGATAREYAQGASSRARDAASSAERKATLMGRELQGKAATAFEEYPLMVAAGGLLVGAALAALIPRTRVEDRYLGETSDTFKGALYDGAAEKISRVATGVENVVSSVADKAEEEDILGTAKGTVKDLADKVGKTLEAGKDAINSELKGRGGD